MAGFEQNKTNRNIFFERVPDLLKQKDIFGEDPVIVRVGGADRSITTLDKDGSVVRRANFMKIDECYELIDVEQFIGPLNSDGSIKIDLV